MIPGSQNQSGGTPIEKYCYNDDPVNCSEYGGLYQWDEMMLGSTTPGIQGICPDGWHIPTDEEWTILTNFLGGETIAGGKMKEAGYAHWNPPNTGATNSSGFTALPGGFRGYTGGFGNINNSGYFWSSSENATTTRWIRILRHINANNTRTYGEKTSGFSVRCIN